VISRRPDIRQSKYIEKDTGHRPSLRDPELWAFMSAYALGALPLGFVLYCASLYLAHPLGRTQEFIGKVLWIPPLGWEVGYFIWGWIADRSLRSGNSRLVSLRRMLTACILLNLFFASTPWVSGFTTVLAVMFLAMFVAAGFVVISVAYATHIYSADHAGLIAGAGAGSWSLVVALTMPYFGRLFDLQRYSQAFLTAAAIPVLGWLGWQILASRRLRIQTPEKRF
jgi:ACS family hexuronate transporter-like MFS transporter